MRDIYLRRTINLKVLVVNLTMMISFRQSFADDDHIKFSSAQDQLIGTRDHTAHVSYFSCRLIIQH